MVEKGDVGARKLVEVVGDIGNKMADEGERKAVEGEAVNSSADVLFHGPHGVLNFRDMVVAGDSVDGEGVEGRAKAGKFMVGMDSRHNETMRGEGGEDVLEETCHVRLAEVGGGGSVTEREGPGDGVEKREVLDI